MNRGVGALKLNDKDKDHLLFLQHPKKKELYSCPDLNIDHK
jgi:hypothetical protein